MAQYRMLLEYDGTDYSGWQLQPDARTVQGVLETALGTVLRHPVRVAASGRTDAGVHAAAQVATFRSECAIDLRELRKSLNALTPPDVSIHEVTPVPDDFDARRHAVARVYEYRIWNQPWRSVFWQRFTWHISRPLDVAAMRFAAAVFVGEHDFSAFRASDCDAKHAVRRVVHSGFTEADGLCVYRVEANAFLKHMVRTIVGTLVEVGTGHRRADDVARVLASRARTRAGETAPPQGLVLTTVRYP